MKTSELRIGNLVNYGGVTSEVSRVDKLFFYVEASETPTFSKDEGRGAKPIQLTEEWLLKLGFVKHGKYGYFYIDFFCVDLDMNGQFFMCDIDIHIVLKHVHQLQNLYFALTGEELTFKSE